MMDLYAPMYFSTFREKGLSGNDAVLYTLLHFLCKQGGAATRSIAWLAGEINVSTDTTVRTLEHLKKKGLIAFSYQKAERGKQRSVLFFLPSTAQNAGKMNPSCAQNACPPAPPYSENKKENIIKEKMKKERDFEAEKEQPLTDEEKAKIRMHQQSVMEKLSRAEAMMKPGAEAAKIARQTRDYCRHGTPQRGYVNVTPQSGYVNEESIEQRAARLMQEAYDKGRAMAATITDRALAERMMAASFHDEPNMQLQKLQRKRFLEGYDNGTATLLQK